MEKETGPMATLNSHFEATHEKRPVLLACIRSSQNYEERTALLEYLSKKYGNTSKRSPLMNSNLFEAYSSLGIDGVPAFIDFDKKSPTLLIITTSTSGITSLIDTLGFDGDYYILIPGESEEVFFKASSCRKKGETHQKTGIGKDILPVCCVCKKIRDDADEEPGRGEWMYADRYMLRKLGIKASHTYCQECAEKAFDELKKSGIEPKVSLSASNDLARI